MDERRGVPRTDVVLADPRLAEAVTRLGARLVKTAVHEAQQRVRDGTLDRERVVDAVLLALPASATSMRPLINATGVVVHTNLGRAPLSTAAVDSLRTAAGATDVELDLATGRRARRGRGAMQALAEAVPDAEAVHVVNNNAAGLVLAATVLALGREILVSRGELVEIGDGFRIPDLLESTGALIREVGTTNRTTFDDYASAVTPATAFVLKVHPSNFVVRGFTSSVDVDALATLGLPVVVDVGSGLLTRHAALPDEPDVATTLRSGASLVLASGDKLLGGPQCGLLLGRADLVERLRRHPLARAVRVDKLTLAALEATLRGPDAPVVTALEADPDELLGRAARIAGLLAAQGIDAIAVRSAAEVGGGGAPGVVLASAAVSLPPAWAEALRHASPPVVGRVADGRCLLDLRAVPIDRDDDLADTVLRTARHVG